VIDPPSHVAITSRPSTGVNPKKSGVHAVGIGALRESALNRCDATIFPNSLPRCTQCTMV
jgi:hypothetical protein